MEANELKTPSAGEDARLEAWLRQPVAPLPDDGFSQRVLAALPPAATTSPKTAIDVLPGRFVVHWTRLAVCAAGAAAGWLVTRLGAPVFAGADMATQLRHAVTAVGGALNDSTTLAGLVLGAAAVIYALRPHALVRWMR